MENVLERAERVRKYIEEIVETIGEHPECELKEQWSREGEEKKAEFIKDIQSIANSEIAIGHEKYLVIGVKESTKSIEGCDHKEFDDAGIRDLLIKYLHPVPEFEVLTLTSSKGIPFVVLRFPYQSKKPAVAIKEIKEKQPSKRVFLQVGDIWYKPGATGTSGSMKRKADSFADLAPLFDRAPSSQPIIDKQQGVLQIFSQGGNKEAAKEGKTKPIFSVPYARNYYFIGRDEELTNLHTNFAKGERVQALTGYGGVGKTQTAIEYAYLYQQDYKLVLWVKAHLREALSADLAAIALLLNLPEKNAQDQNEAVSAAKRWLENNDGWLLILDNADNLPMVREFIPVREGHILLTTQAQNTRPLAVQQTVEKMNPQKGARFLLERLGIIPKGAPLETAPEESRNQAEAIAEALDGLPLALDQTAAYIEETPSTLKEYFKLYKSERSHLLASRGELSADHPESVATTFSLAFKKVIQAKPAAADLLRLCAFLNADAIPEAILSADITQVKITEALKEAGRFSLLRRNPEMHTVNLHRLVQVILRDEMSDDEERQWAKRAVLAVNKAFPTVEYAQWEICSQLIPHVQVLASTIDKYDFDFLEAALIMSRAGYYLTERAQYMEAAPLCQRALAIREKALGTDHPSTATSLNNLASLYDSQGKYAEAEPLYQRALAIREKHK